MSATGSQWFLDRPDLLCAAVGWGRLLEALQGTSGEQFQVLGPLEGEWFRWAFTQQREIEGWRTRALVAGEHEGRSYVLGSPLGPGDTADRITALASVMGEVVVGFSDDDSTGVVRLTVARGQELLRYRYFGGGGEHSEGDGLPRELGIHGVLETLGFAPDAWLAAGRVLRLLWTMLDPEEDGEAHRRLYFGPLRQRVEHIEQAGFEAIRALTSEWDVVEEDDQEQGQAH